MIIHNILYRMCWWYRCAKAVFLMYIPSLQHHDLVVLVKLEGYNSAPKLHDFKMACTNSIVNLTTEET